MADDDDNHHHHYHSHAECEDVQHALRSSPRRALEATLEALCARNERSHVAILKMLALETALVRDEPPPQPRPLSTATPGARVCVRCRATYDQGRNAAQACLYHAGDLYADDTHSDAWASLKSWNTAVRRGLADARRDALPGEELLLGFPDQAADHFRWACCRREYRAPGCTRAPQHVAAAVVVCEPLPQRQRTTTTSGEAGEGGTEREEEATDREPRREQQQQQQHQQQQQPAQRQDDNKTALDVARLRDELARSRRVIREKTDLLRKKEAELMEIGSWAYRSAFL